MNDTNITLIGFPSSYIPEHGPKILIAGHHEWKNNIIENLKEHWIDDHLNIYYISDEHDLFDRNNYNMYLDISTWLCLQYSICDIFIGHFYEHDNVDCVLNTFVMSTTTDKKAFVMYDNNLAPGIKSTISFFSQNKHESRSIKENIKRMKMYYKMDIQ